MSVNLTYSKHWSLPGLNGNSDCQTDGTMGPSRPPLIAREGIDFSELRLPRDTGREPIRSACQQRWRWLQTVTVCFWWTHQLPEFHGAHFIMRCMQHVATVYHVSRRTFVLCAAFVSQQPTTDIHIRGVSESVVLDRVLSGAPTYLGEETEEERIRQ